MPHPTPPDCRRLFPRNYQVYINIGACDFERRGEQRVEINVDGDITGTLRNDLARMLLEHPQVNATKVSTEKPDVYPV